jgi:hypothetical protein
MGSRFPDTVRTSSKRMVRMRRPSSKYSATTGTQSRGVRRNTTRV